VPEPEEAEEEAEAEAPAAVASTGSGKEVVEGSALFGNIAKRVSDLFPTISLQTRCNVM
jgi:hypothetical protein